MKIFLGSSRGGGDKNVVMGAIYYLNNDGGGGGGDDSFITRLLFPRIEIVKLNIHQLSCNVSFI